jgi:hypothetical protein
MPFAPVGEYYLTSVLKPVAILVIGVPGRRIGAKIIAAFRDAGAVSRSTAQRFRAATEDEVAALRGMLEVEIIRQSEPGRYFFDEAALDAWLGLRWPQRYTGLLSNERCCCRWSYGTRGGVRSRSRPPREMF